MLKNVLYLWKVYGKTGKFLRRVWAINKNQAQVTADLMTEYASVEIDRNNYEVR